MRINPDLYSDLILDIADLANDDSTSVMEIALSGKYTLKTLKKLVREPDLVYIRSWSYYDETPQCQYSSHAVEITLVSI